MVNILVAGQITGPRAHRLRDRAPADWQIRVWDPAEAPAARFAELAAEAEVLVGDGPPEGTWPHVPWLRFWQIPWAGHEFTGADRVPAGVLVANTYEHETTMAEYVMAAVLEWQVDLRRMDARFRAEGWGGHEVATGPSHAEVRGRTLGIVGYGHIGHAVALRARAFGMRVIGLRRSARACPPELDWLGGPGDLHRLLAEADFTVVACDLNAETRGMIDAAALAAMKPSGVLINVARGKVVVEDALYAALSQRRIGGAVIDVWYRYGAPGEAKPWPAHHPFEDLDNVILSAHESANTEEMFTRRWDAVAANIARVARGDPPENLLFEGAMPRP